MPLDASILEGLKVSDPFQSFVQGQEQAKEIQRKDALAPVNQRQQEAKAQSMELDNLSAREKSRVSSEITGAARLKPLLDAGDLEGAQLFLNQRRANLLERMGAGENLDTTSTDRAMELLDAAQSGDTGALEKLNKSIGGMVSFGQQSGILSRSAGSFETSAIKNQRALQERLNQGDTLGATALARTMGMLGVGQQLNQDGSVSNVQGFEGALTGTEGAKETGKQIAKSTFEPQRKADIAKREAEVKIETEKTLQKAKDLPVPVQKEVQSLSGDIAVSDRVVDKALGFIEQIETGKINLSLAANAFDKARKNLALSTEETVAKDALEQFILQTRNDLVSMEKGVQTDSDAQRMLDEVIPNLNDPNVVMARLMEMVEAQGRSINLKKKQTNDFFEQNSKKKRYDDIDEGLLGSLSTAPQAQQAQPTGGDMSEEDIMRQYGL